MGKNSVMPSMMARMMDWMKFINKCLVFSAQCIVKISALGTTIYALLLVFRITHDGKKLDHKTNHHNNRSDGKFSGTKDIFFSGH